MGNPPQESDVASVMNEFKDQTIPNYIKTILPALGIKKWSEVNISWKSGNIFIQIVWVWMISVDKWAHYSVKWNTIEFTPTGIEFMKWELKLVKQKILNERMNRTKVHISMKDLQKDITNTPDSFTA